MQRISAGMMVVHKWVMPALSLAIFALIFLSVYREFPEQPIFWALVAVAAGYLFQVVASLHLADEVIDCGDRLKVRRGKVEETIALADIKSVSISYLVRTPYATLRLREPSRFGSRIVFLPKPNSPFGTWGASVVVEDLKQRVLLASATSAPSP
ncbi:hypothetical protein [Pseudomonas sp. CGJS7]|uniref:hypothetical protein n=1 Tax=Pseudomonas sp. CGJS7 TaxID=3109348 RepID=UPI00300AE511